MSAEVVDFGIPGALTLPNGVCQVPGHGSNININGVPACLRCNAARAKAEAQPVGVVTVSDPGHAAMAGLLARPLPPEVQTIGRAQPAQVVKPVVSPQSFEAGVREVLDVLERLPFPPNERSYKFVLKLKNRVRRFLSNEEGE